MMELSYGFLSWFRRYYFLYLLGFLIYFKPINPFLYEMMTTVKNITEDQFLQKIYPISVYSNVVFSFLILLFISFCFFNYVLVIACIGGIVFSVFIWQSDVVSELQVAETFHGGIIATDGIYYASIYVCPDAEVNVLRLTSYIRAVPLASKMISAFFGFVMLGQGWLNLRHLTFFSVAACFQTVFIFIHLPPLVELIEPPDDLSVVKKISWTKSKFKESFSKQHILKWSLWSAFSTSGYNQVANAMQPLWRETQLKYDYISYNGAVEGILLLLALLGVLLIGKFEIDWKFYNSILTLTSSLQAVLLFIIAFSENAWIFNTCYVIFGCVCHVFTASLSVVIARVVYSGAGLFGIVFSFMGLVTAVVNLIFVLTLNSVGITLQQQFIIYGGYYTGIAVTFSISWILSKMQGR